MLRTKLDASLFEVLNEMTDEESIYRVQNIETAILTVRGQKIILDSDLARLYGVPTKVLNQAIKRNRNRFPADFMFRLTVPEATRLRSQPIDIQYDKANRSQFVTGSSKHRDPHFQPYVFTEHGAIMVATVLNSPQAVQMSVFVVRAFIRMRQALLSRVEMEKRLEQIEKILLVHDDSLRDLYGKIRPLLLPPPDPPTKPIGFQVRESGTRYTVGRKKRNRRTHN
jgi:hypothetical protein